MSSERYGMKARRAKRCRKLSKVLGFSKSLYTEWGLPRLNEWILIQSIPNISTLTPTDQAPSPFTILYPHEEVVHIPREHLNLTLLDRKLLLETSAVSLTVLHDGTLGTAWSTRQADECPQLNESLVVTAGVFTVEQRLS